MRKHLISVLLLWVGLLGGAGLAFLTQLLLAHTVTVVEMGAITGVMSLMMLAMPVAEFGISGLWLQVFGQDGRSAFTWVKPSLHIVLIASVAVVVGLLLIGQWAWDTVQQRELLYWLLILPSTESVVVLVGARMQLEGRYRILSLWRALPKFSRLLVTVAAWWIGFDVVTIAIGYCLSSLIVLFISVVQLIPMLQGKVKLEKQAITRNDPMSEPENVLQKHRPSIKKVIRHAWPFAIGSVFSLIYMQSDIFMLSALYDTESTGLYGIAFSLIACVYLLPTAIFNQFLLPRYHRWAVYDRYRFLQAYRLGNGYMILVGLIVMLLLAWLAPYMVQCFFGVKYAEAGKVVRLLALSVPFRYVASSIGNCLVTQNHIRCKIRYQLIVALLHVGFNLLLIPRYGMYGAAVATVTSEMMLCALYLMGVWKHIFGIDAVRGWTLNYKLG